MRMISAGGKIEGKETGSVWLTTMLLGAIAMVVAVLMSGSWSAQASGLDQSGAQGKGVISPECGPDWVVISSPNPGTEDHILDAVTAVAPNNVWAVGHYNVGGVSQTLITHWDGNEWTVVSSPNPGTGDHYLSGVAAVSASDVWAVGSYKDASGPYRTLIMRWNGSIWSVVASPNVGNEANGLDYVAVASANDLWAVGKHTSGGLSQTLTMRWTSATWSVVPSPNPGTENYLYHVDVASTNDVWAVGYKFDGPVQLALILRWNGSVWSVVSSPLPGVQSRLRAVEVISATEAWAVGGYYDGTKEQTLILRWNGSVWNLVVSPNLGSGDNEFNAVAAVSANNVWAVGYYDYSETELRTLVARWDGLTWSVVASPSEGGRNYLWDVTALSATDVWTVGNYRYGSASQTLIERYNPCPGYLTPSPTPGGPTPTACPVQYTDVPAENTFYANIRCLACRGIVSGYPDGTFRPSNSVSRGQIAKIVSNAAGLAEGHYTQTFEDIPTSHTFYLYIDRLASRGIIGGYACGGPGELCVPPGNKPYFRSNSNASRGQLAKIVCRAFGCEGTPSGQTFEDVPPSHTFYTEIEQVYALGAISGYACGGPGEPCGQGNRPYYRPNNSVSRGQTAKIVGNAFYPDCQTP